MEKSQIAELVLDARSLWQMYYVEGVVAFVDGEYPIYVNFWLMKSAMAKLAGLNKNMLNGCPFCAHFMDSNNKCRKCPLDWPNRLSNSLFPPCERIQSPYKKWKLAESAKEARTYSDAMIKLCEKWLDENHFAYEK
jgi:hypothetical protein